MRTDIILAGVGGQGIVSIAASIGLAAVKNNLNLKQSEVHGMSQRGGAVQSHLRISDNEIASDLISLNSANLILSVEPMEALRYISYLSPIGWLITNSVPFINIPNYPEIEKVLAEIKKFPKHIVINADEIAINCGSVKASNMVMLGAASPFIKISSTDFEYGITELFKNKGESVIDINLSSYREGRNFAILNLPISFSI
jgi:indolepyruvate ferredoxin oxidoreductase beta subunit